MRSSAALINASSPQHAIMLEPPVLINGSVTPVSGRIHEIDHTDIILLNKRNNICLSKLGGRLFQSSHQTVRIH